MDTGAIAKDELKSQSILYRILNVIERAGNAVPNPVILFVGLSVIVVGSAIVSTSRITVQHPTTNETIKSFNLLAVEGLHRIMTGLVSNFTGFAPLGTVLVALLGLAVAEASGLIRTTLKQLVMSSPKKLLTVVVVFAGVLSHTARDRRRWELTSCWRFSPRSLSRFLTGRFWASSSSPSTARKYCVISEWAA
jgi:aminobenzoyl-glutamate transport protein